jgi:SAM-dependent methyltransferase
MEGYGPATYGDRIADVYDALYVEALDTDRAAETLADLAAGGPVLELAIGTGRLALPLVERGLEVHGVDASERMVEKLRAKPGGEAIRVTMGDFADVPVEGEYPLVFIAFNTLFALLTQEDQLRCFENVARHLTDDGAFVVEAFFPDLARFDRDQRTQATWVDGGQVMLDASRHNAVEQRVDSQHVVITEEGTKLYPVSIRYAFPSELDLMARLAGLRLRERWGSWKREPFTAQSGRHVSVYGR